ncbi:MAG: DNA polymerase II, partial [Granulosicoccus sp.]
WRDTTTGVELAMWATSEKGPIKLIVNSQKSVCFIDRDITVDLSPGVERKSVNLERLRGGDVDALYFSRHAKLQQFRNNGHNLCESDVKPSDRYLMERFITAGMRISGTLTDKAGHLLAVNPRLQADTYQPQLKAVAIDIETRGRSNTLYSIAAATMKTDQLQQSQVPEAVVFMVGQDSNQQRNGYELRFHPTETAVLQAFFDWLTASDPDVLTGWAVVNFDLNFIDRKCRSLGIPFRLGRNNEVAAVLQPGNPGSPRVARVPGRAVLDGVDQLKAGFWAFESFSLENVSRELLGSGKLISSEKDKVAEINDLFMHDKPSLADYNLRDCTLVNEIFQKANLLEFAQRRASLTGLALDRLGGSVAAFDNLYLPRLHRAGYVAPDVKQHHGDTGSPGGYVIDSLPGLYKNVLVLDFKSLYPSIIRTFLIDPLGLALADEEAVPGFVGASFSRQQHILPGLIKELWAARDAAKRKKDAPLSQAIKIIINSFYGVLGTTGCRFYSQQLASSITRRGHEIIIQSKDWIEQQGYQVIYGDTDSLFVWVSNDADRTQCRLAGEQMMQGLNDWWKAELLSRYQLPSFLEVEFETHYEHFFMPTVRGMATGSKKRYAGLCVPLSAPADTTAQTDTQLIIKGLEAARTDWTPLARSFQRELFRRVFTGEPFNQYIRELVQQVRNGELDEQLVYRKRIRRNLADYQRNVPPHIQAARKLQSSGSHISYVITRQGPEPIGLPHAPLDHDHYLEKQLAPAADSILQFMDTSFATITDAQMDMF